MRTYTITLTSKQFVIASGDVTDHWLFYDLALDPATGVNFTYPNSADGSFFSATTGTYVYPFTADGGIFYPSGFGIINIVSSLTAGPLKGPYTIVFDPTGLDYSLYGIQKIIYDFGDGQNQVIEYPIGSGYAGTILSDAPNNAKIAHDYYPQSTGVTTYYPSVSVVNGNLVKDIFRITAIFVPASLYELKDIHLINNIYTNSQVHETINIFELESPRYITHARVLSAS